MKAPFDFRPYDFTLDGTLMAMDPEHIQMLHLAALQCPTDTAVEIGSYRGASTAALIEAMNAGAFDNLHILETHPTEELGELLALKKRGLVHLHTQESWRFPSGAWFNPGLIFIDGSHDWPALADTLWALSLDAPIIAMHDSNSHPKFAGTWGAKMAADLMRNARGRRVFEDKEAREGKHTDRGFFVSAQPSVDLDTLVAYQETL